MTRLLSLMIVLVALVAEPCSATVDIVVNTNDGLVIAADSRMTLQDSAKTRVASDYIEKIKQVGSHTAVTFCGAAHLYDSTTSLRSIGSIIDQYRNNSGISELSRIDPRAVAVGLDSLLTALYNAAQMGNVGQGQLKLYICGYDDGNKRRVYTLTYPNRRAGTTRPYDFYGSLDSIFASGVPGADVCGQSDVWTRMIKGYDPQLARCEWYRDVKTTTSDSLDSTLVDTVVKRETLDLGKLRYEIKYDLMTLQDAIDFAVFIVRATIEAQRFNQDAVQGVGGAIDIAVITADGFRWIQHKQLHGED